MVLLQPSSRNIHGELAAVKLGIMPQLVVHVYGDVGVLGHDVLAVLVDQEEPNVVNQCI